MNIDYHMLYRGELKHMKSFRVKNVKSFKDSGAIEFKPITIFVGKNSCGKSSLLRFPVVLAQTAISNTDSPLMLYGKMKRKYILKIKKYCLMEIVLMQ